MGHVPSVEYAGLSAGNPVDWLLTGLALRYTRKPEPERTTRVSEVPVASVKKAG